MRILKKIPWFCSIFVIGLTLFQAGCRKAEDPWAKVPGGSKRVLVTIPPLYCFAKKVAGDDAAVLCLLAAQGPHDYQATANDALKARKASVFFSIGLELDEFTGKVVKSSGNPQLEIIELGEKALPPKLLLASADHGHDHGSKEDEHHHKHGDQDPHVWLGIPQAIQMVEYIGTTLQRIDPANKEGYEKRAGEYVKELKKLHQEGLDALKGKKNRKLIATHDSLRYFAASFNLDILDSIQPRPGIEAESAKMTNLVKLCKEKDVRVIAIEPQYPSAAAEALKKQLGQDGVFVELVEIDPMETVAPAALEPDYYVNKMRENINQLAKKLP